MKRRKKTKSIIIEDDRTGMSEATVKRAFLDNLFYLQGSSLESATPCDYYMALSYTVRDRLINRWLKSWDVFDQQEAKIVCYLSAEFLMGRQLANNLLNTACFSQVRRTLEAYDLNLFDVLELEPEPGLGNGGLGRLAACFLDSLATLDIPAVGYGIRYEFGIFRQSIEDGWQVEHPDKWLTWGNPWEIARPHRSVTVGFGGYTDWVETGRGEKKAVWVPANHVLGIPYDTMVPGFGTPMVNTLRLWSARASNDFDFQIFNAGDYSRAVSEKTGSENISKVLYPNDGYAQGRELRLKQQFFFVSCSLQDIIRYLTRLNRPLDELPKRVAIQLNDTHPAVAVAELMRLLVDEHNLTWEKAWDITVAVCGYTNHTLMSEALERWPVSLFGALLPRHLEIIYEINRRFLDAVAVRFPNEPERLSRMSIIEEGGDKKVRMANLATVGSHKINGVAKLHSELVKKTVLNDFYQLWPERFTNVTNGVTPRRWLMLSNPTLTYLITERIGRGWLKDLGELRALEKHADDPVLQEIWDNFKTENKVALGQYTREKLGVSLDPDGLFDIQVKRIHEYKRQLLNILHVVWLYLSIKDGCAPPGAPRMVILSGKAAPGYAQAKRIIKLINCVASVVNNDPEVSKRLRVVFLPNFCVSLGEKVYPAADLSEQISTAGTEASGTGNMKFALNGSLTIGTLDGANIEIRDAVGAENFFLFGHTVEELEELRRRGYNPRGLYEGDERIKRTLDTLSSGLFSDGDRDMFRPIVDELLNRDTYFLLADFAAYVAEQEKVALAFLDRSTWVRKAIINVARMGYFSSDRTIREYAEQIWNAKPVSFPTVTEGNRGEQRSPVRGKKPETQASAE